MSPINPALLASQPGAGKAMADMVKEMSKLKGVPVMQVMRMGTTCKWRASAGGLGSTVASVDVSSHTVRQDRLRRILRPQRITSQLRAWEDLAVCGHKKKATDPAPAAPENAQAQGSAGAGGVEHADEQLLSGCGRCLEVPRFLRAISRSTPRSPISS